MIKFVRTRKQPRPSLTRILKLQILILEILTTRTSQSVKLNETSTLLFKTLTNLQGYFYISII